MSPAIPPLPPGGERLVLGDSACNQDRWVAFSDGSVKKARAAAAYVLYADEGNVHQKTGWTLPEPTRDSNVPELAGLLEVVQVASKAGVTNLVCLTDSFQAVQALLRAVQGVPSRYPAVGHLLELAKSFRRIEFRNIERRHNKEADLLCQAYR